MGFQLLEYLVSQENELNKYEPLAGSYAVVKCEDKYLICFNKWKPMGITSRRKRRRRDSELIEDIGCFDEVDRQVFKFIMKKTD